MEAVMLHRILCVIVLLVLGCVVHRDAVAQSGPLRGRLEEISAGINAKVGVAVVAIENDDTLSIDGTGQHPMQSVYKFPLALAVMHSVDEGKFSLQQKIRIRRKDLLPNTWSPLREKYPKGNIDLPLAEVIRYTVAQSDNNGCDILFRLMGGTAVVEKYIHSLGVTGIAIVATEEEMHKDDAVQYRNWCAPAAMGQLLRKFYRGEVLSVKSTAHLRQVMEQTSTGPARLKGTLPAGTVVAHKTGSSGTNDTGLVAATNDVGVVTLPDGRHVAIAVFVSDAKTEEKICEEVIARIANAVWNAYIQPRGEIRNSNRD
jgi:beta-lactamase class A